MADVTSFVSTSERRNIPVRVVSHSAVVTTSNIGDVVFFVPVKKGWRIVDVILGFEGTATSTVSIGDSGSATRFASAVSTAASGVIRTSRFGGVGYRYTADNRIDLTIGGATVAAKTYSLTLLVEVDQAD